MARLGGIVPVLVAFAAIGALAAVPMPARIQDKDWAPIAKKYEISFEMPAGDEIKVPCDGYTVIASPASKTEISDYRELFQKEWNYYPPSLIKKVGLKRVVFCKDLKMDKQARSAIPSFDTNTLYLDVEAGKKSADYQRVVIHHEFFHMIDKAMGTLEDDPKWQAIMPGFTYGTGGKDMQTAGVGELSDELFGFVTKYATSAMEEDKAEMFAHMIVHAHYLRTRCASDGPIARKILMIQARMAKFDAACGDEFWKSIPGWG